MLSWLREPHRPGPSPLARLVAIGLLVALIGGSAPVLVPVVGWVLSLL